MKRFILFCWLLYVVSCCSSNEHKVDHHLTLREKFPLSSLKQDYEQLARVVKKNHPALYDFVNRGEYESLIKLQYEKITDSLTIFDFYNILSPVLTEIGCGHSGVRLPDWVWKDSAVTLFPFDLFFQNKRGFIIKSYSPVNGPSRGTEILSINGKDIPSWMVTLEKYISTDGNNLSNKLEALNQSFPQLFATYIGFPEQYDISFRLTEKDSIQRMIIPSIKAQSYFDTQSKSDSLLQFEIDLATSTALITINSFGFYDRLHEFKTFVDSCFSQIQHAKIDHVILDLRNNGGGDPHCAAYLMTYLAKKPIVYFSEPYPAYTALAKPLPLSINHFSGKVYTLINGICFSTTGHLCALLKYHQVGEFIGTETGGTYTCNDNSQTFRLINTGILVRVARSTFTVAVEGLPRFKGISPDYIVEQSLHDRLAGKDPVKDFAQTRISKSLNN